MVRIPTLKSPAEFRSRLAQLQLELPCDDTILKGSDSPLSWPNPDFAFKGKQIQNRWSVQPMEGWDGTRTGGITDDVRRRWRRFGESGAQLICGGEAMAVRADGRANPNQLIICPENKRDLAELRQRLLDAHAEKFGDSTNVVIGFQLTHSGRFCRPNDHKLPEPRVAYRHPLLDPRSSVTSDAQVMTDSEVEQLITAYIDAAKVAWEAGADFVDIKHCHGYLLHEFLSARDRPGPYGGSFENRTRLLREIVQGIRASGNPIDLAVRLSAFDSIPFRPDPAQSFPGRPGPGIPEDCAACLPYRYGFGVNPANPLEPDLTETFQFAEMCVTLGVKILNLTAGSPYYNPHLQRPAAYPPSDGYLPPEDPLIGVVRQIEVVRKVRAFLGQQPCAGPGGSTQSLANRPPALASKLLLVGSGYSYLQEFLPHVAQAVIRLGWTDLVGIGRMVLSYPSVFSDAISRGSLNPKGICRTFSDCTTAPRNGMVSGCYPLDPHFAQRPEAAKLKVLKRPKSA